MDSGTLIMVLWLSLPVVLVTPVWWSWSRGNHQGAKWRRTATLISTSAATGSSALIGLTLIWGKFGSAPAFYHPSLFGSLLLVGFGLSIVSIVAVGFGTGWRRWLIVPAAVLQGLTWLLAAHLATAPLFPG